MRHSDSPSMSRAEPGINGLTRWGRNLSRFPEFTQPETGMVQAEVTAPGRQDRCWVAILDQ